MSKRFNESIDEILNIAKETKDYFKIKSLIANIVDEFLLLKEKNNWIPVSERLPEPQDNGDKNYSDWLLITLNLGKDDEIYTDEAFYCFSEKKWYSKRIFIGEVTAWMSLPKPYKSNTINLKKDI